MFKLNRRTVAAAVTAAAAVAGSASLAATTASAATGQPAAASAPVLIPRCTADDVAVWLNSSSAERSGGTINYHLDFTNTSSRYCHLYSWPGVAAMSSADKQLGPAAERNSSVAATYVNIAPGATAHAQFGYATGLVTKACKPVLATHLNVFPPDDSGSRAAFFAASACTKSVKDLVIGRVQSGT
jgi:Protein of unknown function (DUF4232)